MRTVAVGLVTLLLVAGCSTSDGEQVVTDQTPAGPTAAETTPTDIAPVPTAVPETSAVTETASDSTTDTPADAANDGLWPTVVDANASTSNGSTWNFAVTLLSEYDSPARYADAWRVLDAADNELGIRVLTHDHAGEQPFTRSATVEIPTELTTVFVEGRDQINGWSGERFELTLDR